MQSTNNNRLPEIDERLRTIAREIRTLGDEKNNLVKEFVSKQRKEIELEVKARGV
jgi:hypothetical protein